MKKESLKYKVEAYQDPSEDEYYREETETDQHRGRKKLSKYVEQASIDYEDEEDGEYEVSGISDEDHRHYSNDEIQLPPSRRPSNQNRRKRAGYREGQRRRISRDPGPYNGQQRHY